MVALIFPDFGCCVFRECAWLKTWFQADIVEHIEVLNGGWIMGIGPSKQKTCCFLCKALFHVLVTSMHKIFTAENVDVSWLWKSLEIFGIL